MNLVGKKKKTSYGRKKIFTNAYLRKQQKFKKTTKTTMYTSLPMCLHTKYYTKGMVYSSVKAKAVTSHKWTRGRQQLGLNSNA